VLLGDPVVQPIDVDSVDEVLFLAPRSQLLGEPLTQAPDLAWHAYAVEYGLRVRRLGLRTGVADIPLTHNSLSINVDRLDVAHKAVAERYPELLPVRTTCGVIHARTGGRVFLPAHRWRYRWLRESLVLRQARGAGKATAVLADIREDVDGVISRSPGRRLHIVNRSQGGFADGSHDPLELTRRDGRVAIAARSLEDVQAEVASREPGSRLLLTNLSAADLAALGSRWPDAPAVLGLHTGIGFWLLLGVPPGHLPPQWRSPKATPLGGRRA